MMKGGKFHIHEPDGARSILRRRHYSVSSASPLRDFTISWVVVAYLIIPLILIITGHKSVYAFQGPLYVRNSHPLFLGIGNPSLTSAQVEESINAHLTYSSTYLVQQSSEWAFNIDLEALITDVFFRRMLGNRVELSLGLPLISLNSGFLDGLLETYHDTFGFGDYGRSNRPHNEFLYTVVHEDRVLIDGRSGEVALGDLLVGIKGQIRTEDPCVGVYGFVEFPTGNPDRGYGNGDVDSGIALLVDKTLGNRFMTYLNAGIVSTDRYRAREDITLKDYLYGGIGVEWMYSRALSFYTQFFIQDSPFETTDIREIDEPGSILSFGTRYAASKKTFLEFSFSEDPNTAGAPDFMITVSSIIFF